MVVVYTHACTHTKHSHNINEQITLFLKKAKALHCCGIYCHDYIENIAVTDEKRHRKIFAFSRPMFEHTGPTYGTIHNESFSVCQSAPKWWQRDIINYEILTSDPYHQQLLLKLTHLWWTSFLLMAFYLVSVFPVLFLSCVCVLFLLSS